MLNRAHLSKTVRDAAILTEAIVVVCPNPKCRREIEEPILLTVHFVTPPKKYQACPYCFTDLTPEPKIEEDVPEPTVEKEVLDEEEETESTTKAETSVLEKVKAGPSFFRRVKSLIPRSSDSQKEKKIEIEEPQAEPVAKQEEELETEPLVAEEQEETPIAEPVDETEIEEAPKPELIDKKETESSGCPEEFGYLANRPPNTPIPSQCLVCPKMVDCMLSPRDRDE